MVLYRPFSVAISLLATLTVYILLDPLGGGAVKVVTFRNYYIYYVCFFDECVKYN
jgi:hypothetical protein